MSSNFGSYSTWNSTRGAPKDTSFPPAPSGCVVTQWNKCEIKQKKLSTTSEMLCKGYPEEFVQYFKYVSELKFDEDPDYGYLRKLFRDLFVRSGFQYDHIFDWTALKYGQSNQHHSDEQHGNEGSKAGNDDAGGR